MAREDQQRPRSGRGKKIFGFVFVVLAIALVMAIGRIFETNKAGYYQIKQRAFFGDLSVRNAPGTYGQWFGDIETYELAGDIFLSKDNTDGGSVNENAAERVLFPNGYADVNFIGVYEIGLDARTADKNSPELYGSQLQLHLRFNNDENIKYMVKQQVIEALKNTGTLMSAEEAYSYKRSDFIRLAREQALNGLYKAKVSVDTVVVSGGQIQLVKHYSVATDENGEPIITKESLLKKYNILLPQFNVKDMDFDEKLVALIEARKDAQKAEQDAITEKAKGEALIAAEKAKQEIAKIKEVTIAQKNKEVAELDAEKLFKVAEFQAKQALEEKKALIAKGEGEAEANRLKVKAGLTPQEEMDMQIKIADAVSKNIANASTPSVVFMGSDKGSANEVMQVFGAERSIELVKKFGVDLNPTGKKGN